MSLIPIVDRYGDAIDVDFWERGDDIRHYLAGRKPLRRLAVILGHLGSDSHFVKARKEDPEEIRRVLEWNRQHPERATSGRPPAADWNLGTELQARILDRLGELLAVQASHPLPKGTRAKKPPRPFPRPATVQERVELEFRAVNLASIEADVAQAQERYRQLHRAS